VPPAGLSTSPKNRLKYWEKLNVSHFHEMALSWITDRAFKPFQAQGIHMGALTADQRSKINCFARKTVKDLNRHTPWVLKDPRMLLFSKFWVDAVRFQHADGARTCASPTTCSLTQAESEKSRRCAIQCASTAAACLPHSRECAEGCARPCVSVSTAFGW
jgi:hypothetical protein